MIDELSYRDLKELVEYICKQAAEKSRLADGNHLSASIDEEYYDAAMSVARNIRTAYRLGLDYSKAKDKNERKEQAQ